MTYLKPFLVPLAVAAALLASLLSKADFYEHWMNSFGFVPYLLLTAALLISFFLKQTETFYQAILFAIVYLSTQSFMQAPLANELPYFAFTLVNVFWPISLIVVYLLRNRVPQSPLPLISLAGISLIWLLPYGAQLGWFDAALARLLPEVFHQPITALTSLSFGLTLTYVIALSFLGALYLIWPTNDKATSIAALLIIYGMFAYFYIPGISFTAFSALGMVLIVSIIRDAYSMAFIDELTGIPGRKALEKKLNSLGRHYSIAMLDVDHFKKFNDKYGHDVGDQVLMLVAAKIKDVTGGGKAFRYGGEEFTIVFPGKTPEQAFEHLEAVRETIANYNMVLRSSDRPEDNKVGREKRGKTKTETVSVTVSIGISVRQSGMKFSQVLKQADIALYKAKNAGRNNTQCHAG